MTKISIDEIKKLAAMTKLHIAEDELDGIRQRLEDVLDYAQRVQLIAKEIQIPSQKNVNHDRTDTVIQGSVEDILGQAPAQEDNYFVVPQIINEQ